MAADLDTVKESPLVGVDDTHAVFNQPVKVFTIC
jgi:hypothetical protein